MPTPIFQVDAFTDRPFAGNPAAVCLLDQERDPRWMQSIAAEMNLAETAFVLKRDDGWGLRWFSPTMEVDLCGHATLAAAHILYEQGLLPAQQPARFHTKSGLLTVTRGGDTLTMDFPAEPDEQVMAPFGLSQGLGVPLQYVGKNRMDYLVMVGSELTLRAIRPDFRQLAQVRTRGIIVTAKAETSGFDYVSRFFAPLAGVDEDPVTGSAQCCLGPFWSRRLGKDEMLALQASTRGGTIRVKLQGERVLLSGQAVTILKGELL